MLRPSAYLLFFLFGPFVHAQEGQHSSKQASRIAVSKKALAYLNAQALERHMDYNFSTTPPTKEKALICHEVALTAPEEMLRKAVDAMERQTDFKTWVKTFQNFHPRIETFQLHVGDSMTSIYPSMPLDMPGRALKQPWPAWQRSYQTLMQREDHPYFNGRPGTWVFETIGNQTLTGFFILSDLHSQKLTLRYADYTNYAHHFSKWHWHLIPLPQNGGVQFFAQNKNGSLLRHAIQTTMKWIEPLALEAFPPKAALQVLRSNPPSFACNGSGGAKRLRQIFILAAEAEQWDLAIQALIVTASFDREAMEILEALPLNLHRLLIGLALGAPENPIYQKTLVHCFSRLSSKDMLIDASLAVLEDPYLPDGIKIQFLHNIAQVLNHPQTLSKLENHTRSWSPLVQAFIASKTDPKYWQGMNRW